MRAIPTRNEALVQNAQIVSGKAVIKIAEELQKIREMYEAEHDLRIQVLQLQVLQLTPPKGKP